MNQAELQKMATERILDAEALLKAGRWAYAYYVAGYAVECALKSCVLAQMIYTGGVFQRKKFAEECFTHDFGELLDLAGLRNALNAQLAASAGAGAAFGVYWGRAAQCKETRRYEDRTQAEAERLYEAITHNPDGVLRWVQNYW